MTDSSSAASSVLRALRRSRRGAAMLCAALLVGLVVSAMASGVSGTRTGAPGIWSVAGSGLRTISGQIGTARTSDGVLHVLWSRGGAGTPWELLDTTVSPSGKVSAPQPIVSGWSRIDDVAATIADGKPLTVVFTGTKTDTTGDPTNGLDIATNDGNGWAVGSAAIYSTNFAGSSVPAIGFTRRGTLLQAWSANGSVVVHVGTDPSVPTQTIGTGGNVTLAGWSQIGTTAHDLDRVSIAWCASGSAPGIDTLEFGADPPAFPVRRLSGSETTRCTAASRTPYARTPVGGADNSSAAASVNSERTVRVWYNASAPPTDVATGRGIKQQVALAADPKGRFWVGWRDADSGRLRFRRSDGATTWGAVVSTALPVSEDSVYNLDLVGQADRVDVIARTTKGSAVSLFHTQMYPGLTVKATTTEGRVTVRVTDAGVPVPGSVVRIGGRLLHTSAGGSAEIRLSPGRYKVTASKTHYVGATTSVQVKRVR